MTSIDEGLTPLVKTVVVPAPPERAFEVFTAEMGRWWPLATHSVRREQATDVRMDGVVGGQITEYDADGPVGSWGRVTEWDPPKSVAFTWHPGTDPDQAGHVSVRFTETTAGTEVELTHTGWERRPDGAAARRNYTTGWDYVLSFFAVSSRR